ncbi:MAG: hypothetical protein U0412_04450 [Nitrospira sp.]
MATDMFEHNMTKLNILRQRGAESFAKQEQVLTIAFRKCSVAIPSHSLIRGLGKARSPVPRHIRGCQKNVPDARIPYYPKTFASFLQGSYANDTNVYRDSDVDVVMRFDSAFYHNALLLPADQYQAFAQAYPGTADYGLPEFKTQVTAWLKQKFNGVTLGSKAVFIPGSGARRNCDVLVCAKFNYYYHFKSAYDHSVVEGICFFLKDGTQMVNFPKQHSDNCTAKHKVTNQWFSQQSASIRTCGTIWLKPACFVTPLHLPTSSKGCFGTCQRMRSGRATTKRLLRRSTI